MKKSLIALAVAGAFAAPAFAATSNVDVYGKLHMSVSLVDDQVQDNPATVGTNEGVNDLQITSNASRFGLKGSEDLGNGLSGIWQIESGVNLDEQSGTLSNRNSFVGLSGGFGTVLLGNHDTPLKLVGRSVDLFGDTLADSRNVMGGGSDTRAKNVLAYISPSFSGLTVAAAYTTDLGDGNNSAVNPFSGSTIKSDADSNGAYNLNATYTNGPIFAGIGYGDGDYHENNGLGAHVRLAGGFTFGNAKIVGQYDSLEDDTAAGEDYTAWMIGGAFTMGNIVLKANYMAGEVDNCVGMCEPTQWTIGADYNLSKRSSLYALYVAGEEGVVLGAGAGSTDQFGSGVASGDVSAFSLGVVHSF